MQEVQMVHALLNQPLNKFIDNPSHIIIIQVYYYYMYIEREDITTHMLHVLKKYFDRIFRGQWLNARTRNSRSRTEGTDFHQTPPPCVYLFEN